jgi:hypothetical protein
LEKVAQTGTPDKGENGPVDNYLMSMRYKHLKGCNEGRGKITIPDTKHPQATPDENKAREFQKSIESLRETVLGLSEAFLDFADSATHNKCKERGGDGGILLAFKLCLRGRPGQPGGRRIGELASSIVSSMRKS